MTEAEWLGATDPENMLYAVGENKRKLRLFGCACCYRIWSLIPQEWARQSVRVAEAYADGLVDDDALEEVNSRAREAMDALHQAAGTRSVPVALAAAAAGHHVPKWAVRAATEASAGLAFAAAFSGAGCAACALRERRDYYPDEERDGDELVAQAGLLRDIFGNPFRPVAVEPSWLASNVLALAEGIYQDRAFDRMPYLADALQDSGCANEDVLRHCREPGEHVRGCWVVDLLTART